jgi:hypothetical protein
LASGLIDRDVTAARKKLDMSGGYPFKGKANPESDLKAIAFQLEGKKMPPWQYRIMHGKSSLSPSQIQAVEDWTARSLDRLDRAGW